MKTTQNAHSVIAPFAQQITAVTAIFIVILYNVLLVCSIKIYHIHYNPVEIFYSIGYTKKKAKEITETFLLLA